MDRNVLIILAFFILFFAIAFISLSLLNSPGDRITIEVKVYGRYGNPLRGAKVELFNVKHGWSEYPMEISDMEYTEDDGTVKFENVSSNELWYIVASKEGYEEKARYLDKTDNSDESVMRNGLVELYLDEKNLYNGTPMSIQ